MKKWILIVIAIAVVLSAALMWVAWREQQAAERALESAEAQWRAVGGVMTLAELKPDPVPDGENAAVLYGRAFALLEREAEEGVDCRDLPDDVADLAAAVEPLRPAIDLAHEAARLDACIWPSDSYAPGNPLMADMEHRTNARNLARVLNADAHLRIRNGDAGGAIRDLESLLHLARHVKVDPCIVALLTGSAIEAMACEELKDLFGDHPLPENEIAAIVAAIDGRADARRAIIGEAALLLQCCEDPNALAAAGVPVPGVSVPDRNKAYCLDYMRRHVEALGAPYHETRDHPIEWVESKGGLLLSRMVPALDLFRRVVALDEIQRTFVLTALELRAYRESRGSYPDEWEMPADPLTGRPLGYEKTEHGFRLFSEAEDGAPPDWVW